MLYSKKELIDILNLNSETSALLTDKLGILDEKMSLEEYARPLLERPYIRNEWASCLLNNFVYEVNSQKLFTSIFDRFRRKLDEFAYGTYETVVEPIMPITYDMKALDRELKYWETTTRAQYFAINRQDLFPMTITREVIAQAFKNYNELDNFFASLLLAPRNGNTIIENEAVKEVINKNFASGALKYVTIEEPSKANADALAELISETVYSMTVASPDFNKWQEIANLEAPHYEQSDKTDLVFMGTSKSISVIRTYVMAYAFNREEIEFNFDFVPVGKTFGYKIYDEERRTFVGEQDSPIQFIICDGGFLKLDDNFEFTGESVQGVMTLATQQALHIWQTIGIRAWRNALVFTLAPDSELTLADDSSNIVELNGVITYDYDGATLEADELLAAIDEENITATFGANGYGHEILGVANNIVGTGTPDEYHFRIEEILSDDATPIVEGLEFTYDTTYIGVESPDGVAVASGDIVTVNIPFNFADGNVQTLTIQFKC